MSASLTLPVLAKFMSGATMYDRPLGFRFDASRRLHTEELQVQPACARTEHEYRRAQAERAARERTELEERMDRIMRTRRA
ncbi:hypothetical protein ACIA6T_13780 [Streptomyces sp. NPDC051740]|uniref:hypothetical protein n=1 Tax=Streptomyces sp. NPDC051740 TaxID=3365673 RepID=UPI0037A7D7C1